MARQIAFLRGINLVRHKRLAMADLRELVAGLGYGDVRTHLQSGNVIFTSADRPETAARRIEERLARDAGMKVAVLVRTRDELAKIVRRDPLGGEASDPSRYFVLFLSASPDPKAVRGVDPAEFEPERFAAAGRELYVWLPNGMQKARLTHAFWEKRLGVTATARNWNTVAKLRALATD